MDSGPSFRKQLYGEYKAHRAAPSAVRLSHYSRPSCTYQQLSLTTHTTHTTQQELRKQFPLVADATRALGIETIKVRRCPAQLSNLKAVSMAHRTVDRPRAWRQTT